MKIHIVGIQWLLDCKAQGKRLPEANYALTSAPSASSSTGNTANTANSKPADSTLASSKRQRSNDASSDEDNSGASGIGNTKQVAKKPKNGEKEGSKTLHVPVDEHCGLGGKYPNAISYTFQANTP